MNLASLHCPLLEAALALVLTFSITTYHVHGTNQPVNHPEQKQKKQKQKTKHMIKPHWIFFFLSVFFLFRAALTANGGSQVTGGIGATAASLHHSSQQCRILNPLSEARDRTHNLMASSQICFCYTTQELQQAFILFAF